MHFFPEKTLLVLLCLLFGISLFNTTLAQDKPNLSEAIHEVIESQGLEAAKQQFASMDPSVSVSKVLLNARDNRGMTWAASKECMVILMIVNPHAGFG